MFRSGDASDSSSGSSDGESSSDDDDDDDEDEEEDGVVLDDPIAEAERLRKRRKAELDKQMLIEALSLPQRDAARRRQEERAKEDHDKKLLQMHDRRLLSERLVSSAGFGDKHNAIRGGDKQNCIKHLNEGADVNFVTSEDSTTNTALSAAVWRGMFLGDSHDSNDDTFFLEMQENSEVTKYIEIVRLLLQRGADPNIMVNPDGHTQGGTLPLILAAQLGGLQMVQLLLDNGADPDASNHAKATAFHLACAMQKPSCVLALIKAGCVMATTSKRGQQGLTLAAAEGHAATVRSLIVGGAELEAKADDG
jgi:ankyrin repeat protein